MVRHFFQNYDTIYGRFFAYSGGARKERQVEGYYSMRVYKERNMEFQ